MPEVGAPLLDRLRSDHHYSFLLPLTIPVLVTAVTFNWWSMKIFRHTHHN